MPKKDKSYSSPKLLTAAPPDSETSWRKPPPKLGKTVLDDLGRGDLGRSIEADIQDIYNFYLDDATRDRLKEVHPVTRVGYITFWVMKNAIFRMNPARRLMLIFTVFLFLYGLGGSASSMAIAFLGILFILFLELKDKLLAQARQAGVTHGQYRAAAVGAAGAAAADGAGAAIDDVEPLDEVDALAVRADQGGDARRGVDDVERVVGGVAGEEGAAGVDAQAAEAGVGA